MGSPAATVREVLLICQWAWAESCHSTAEVGLFQLGIGLPQWRFIDYKTIG